MTFGLHTWALAKDKARVIIIIYNKCILFIYMYIVSSQRFTKSFTFNMITKRTPFQTPNHVPPCAQVPKVAGLDSFFRRGSIHPVSTELDGGFKHSASVLLTNKWRNKWFQTFFIFTPQIGAWEDWFQFDKKRFQMGWNPPPREV